MFFLLSLLLPLQPVFVDPVSVCAICAVEPGLYERAHHLMNRLQRDLHLTREAAAAVAAHAIAESNIRAVDERNPAVPGSRGGIGYLQWTGESLDGRRRAYEQFAALHKLDPHSDEASVRFFEHELSVSYPVLLHTLRTPGLTASQQVRALQPYLFGLDPTLNTLGAKRALVAEMLVHTAAKTMPATMTAAKDTK